MEFISKIEKGKLTFLNEEKVKSFISSIEGKDVVIDIKKHKKIVLMLKIDGIGELL